MKRFLLKLSCAVGINVIYWLLIIIVAELLDKEQAEVERLVAITVISVLSLVFAKFLTEAISGKEEKP